MTAFSDAVEALTPLGYWRCEETSGSLIDSSLSATDLALTGTGVLYQQAGADGKGIRMPGAARYDTTLGAGLVDIVTVMAWVKRSTAAAFRNICTAGDGTTGFQIRLANSSHIVQVIRGDIAQCGASTIDVPLDGRWHSIFVTKTTATAPLIYIDGVDVTAAGGTGTAWTGTTALKVGARHANDRFWDGFLDEIAVWDSVLTPTNISDLDALGSNAASVQRKDDRRRRR